jgi:hypothetical protein
MKKIYLLLIVTLITGICAYAQEPKTESAISSGVTPNLKRTYRISLGVKGGVNFSTLSGNPNDVSLNAKSNTGFHAGIVGNIHFGQKVKDVSQSGTGPFGLQVEALYSQYGAKTDLGNPQINYFEVPVLLQYYVFPNIDIEAGPTFAGVISSSPDKLSNENVSYKTGDWKGSDIKASIGICYKNKSGLMLSARYNYGTSNLAGDFPCKTSAFTISLGWLFDIVK